MESYGDKLDVNVVINKQTYDHLRLCCGAYSNYVIRSIIENNAWYSTLPAFVQFRDTFIIDVFHGDILELSSNRYGSNVVAKCITVCSEAHRKMLISTLTRSKCFALRRMLDNDAAHYILKLLFSECSDREKSYITHRIDKDVVNLCFGDINAFQPRCAFLMRCREFKQRVDNNADNDDIPLISSVSDMEIASPLPTLETSTDPISANALQLQSRECQAQRGQQFDEPPMNKPIYSYNNVINFWAGECNEECQQGGTLSNMAVVHRQSNVSFFSRNTMFINDNHEIRPKINNEYVMHQHDLFRSQSQSIEFSASTSNFVNNTSHLRVIKLPKPKRGKTIKAMVEENYTLSQIMKFQLLERFLFDREGAIYLQTLLKTQKSDINHKISLLMEYCLRENICLSKLSCHVYANYIMSMLFQCGNKQQRDTLFQNLIFKPADTCQFHHGHNNISINKGLVRGYMRCMRNESSVINCCYEYYSKPCLAFCNLFSLCTSKPGCRVAQSMINCIDGDKLSQIIQCLKDGPIFDNTEHGYLADLLLSPNASFVILGIVRLKLPYQQIKFIVDELQSNLGMTKCFVSSKYLHLRHVCTIQCITPKMNLDVILFNQFSRFMVTN